MIDREMLLLDLLAIALLGVIANSSALDVDLLGFTLLVLAISVAIFSAICMLFEKILVFVRKDGRDLGRHDYFILGSAGLVTIVSIVVLVQIAGWFLR